jgi:hypothetical protein
MEENLELINNIYPDIKITYFSRSEKPLLSTLLGDAIRMCRSDISPGYIKNSLKKFTDGLLINSLEGERLGFCLLKQESFGKDDSKSAFEYKIYKVLHVLLVCSKDVDIKVGPILLYNIDKFAIEQGCSYIQLEASKPKLVEVYQRYGYNYIGVSEKDLTMKKFVAPIKLIRRKNTSARSTPKLITQKESRKQTRKRIYTNSLTTVHF